MRSNRQPNTANGKIACPSESSGPQARSACFRAWLATAANAAEAPLAAKACRNVLSIQASWSRQKNVQRFQQANPVA
eukprot:4988489-Amphidinium_carterae.1